MKNRWLLFVSIFQIVIGAAAIISFFALLIVGEDVTQFIPAAILSVAFVVLGIIGLADY